MRDIEYNNKIPEATNQIKDNLRKFLISSADEVVRRARVLAPVQTGELRDKIHHEFTGDDEVSIISGAPHGTWVELGTSKMAARPYLTPAIHDSKFEINRLSRLIAKINTGVK